MHSVVRATVDFIRCILSLIGFADGELPYWKKAVRKMVEGGPCAKPKNRPSRYPRFEHPAVPKKHGVSPGRWREMMKSGEHPRYPKPAHPRQP
jgi:hypothetical protein